MCSCMRGVSGWFTPLACGPGFPELSKSYMDMASKLFTFTFTFTCPPRMHCMTGKGNSNALVLISEPRSGRWPLAYSQTFQSMRL